MTKLHQCHICEKDFQHKLGSLVRHLQIKHKCENVCEKCEYTYFFIHMIEIRFIGSLQLQFHFFTKVNFSVDQTTEVSSYIFVKKFIRY